jgi:hypothetical protein
MQQTVRAHIKGLESLLRDLDHRLAEESDVLARREIEAEMQSVKMAITHYQLALDIEDKLAAGRKHT